MKYFLIAGEASGDMHAARLMEALAARDPQAVFYGMGGDRMKQAGLRLVQDYREMAFMGVMAVLANLGKVRRNFHIARESLWAEQPDALILIDYPTFNLRIAAWCRRHLPKTKIYYYIPPKVWAWKTWRIHRLARLADRIFCILPFEPAFYARYGYKAEYVGNPTVEEISNATMPQRHDATATSTPLIALLPGSRRSEISHCLPRMLQAALRCKPCHITVCAAPGIDEAFYRRYMGPDRAECRLVFNQTYDTLREAAVAVVNSGTATLEAALIGCPQVAVYHIAAPAWAVRLLRPLLFSIPHFTLANLIAGKEVIAELLAERFTTDNAEAELRRLLSDENARRQMLRDYQAIRTILGTASAAQTAAQAILP
ncbi:MAG: lipid-A-disaccharide synthase [Paludibacteraceae bacterium]|nr:lipid-A-disaccharide synthase [Paludibacteraceae bacterium]